MNPDFADADPAALRLALTRATPGGRRRALELVTTRLQTLKANVAAHAVPETLKANVAANAAQVLQAFLDLDGKTFGPIALPALADAHELLNQVPEAVRAIDAAVLAAREANVPADRIAQLTTRATALRTMLPPAH